MYHKSISNRINRIGKKLGENGPGLSVITQHPGEPEEALQRRADELKDQQIRQFGQSGNIVIVTNYSGKGCKNVTEQ